MGNVPTSIMRRPPQPQPQPQPQRPSHHHRSQMADVKEERITEMIGGDSSSAYYLRRCKRKRLTNIDSLPDELLFDVLIRLPAQDVYNHARLVCRKWFHIIHTSNFIYAHLHRTTYGILFHSDLPLTSSIAPTEEGQIEISKFRKYDNWNIAASCNGLVLGCDFLGEYGTLYIRNPVTRHMFVLPPLYRTIHDIRYQGIAYAAASMEYKVVSTSHPTGFSAACAILTVGVDKSWRNVRTDHLSSKIAFASSPHITEGFLHWSIKGSNQVLTLNIETEIVTETPPPIPLLPYGTTYLSGERYLSLLIKCGDYSWEVWEMKPESGEWRKLPKIAIEAQKLRLKPSDDYPKPFCWLKYLEVLVFHVGPEEESGLLYNLRTQEIGSIELPFYSVHCTPLVHKSSLVWLDGC